MSCSCPLASAKRPAESRRKARHALAQVLVVTFAVTGLEEDVEHLVHIDPQEAVREAHSRCEERQNDRLADGMRRQMLASESGHLQVELDDESAVQPAEDADEDEEAEFEKVPIPVEAHLEQYDLAGSERVHRLRKTNPSVSAPSLGSRQTAHRKNNIRDEGTEEASPHRLDRPIDRHFLVSHKVSLGPAPYRAGDGGLFTDFEREQHAADRTPERYGDSGCRRRCDDLPHLGCRVRMVHEAEDELGIGEQAYLCCA